MRLFLLLLLLGPQTSQACPGVKTVVSSKGLDYVTNLVTGWVQEKLLTADLPVVRGSIVGVSYALYEMKVIKVDMPQPSVNFEEDTGLRVEFSGLNIAVAGSWRTSFGIIKDGGTFDLALFNVDISSLLQLGSDNQARLSVECLTCDAQIGSVDVNFHGGASFFIQAFVDLFPGHIKGIIQGNICPVVEDQVKNLEGILAAMHVDYHVDPSLIFSVPLTNAPVVKTSGIEVDLKGVFYSETHPKEPPFPPEVFQLPWKADYMISLGISQYSLNTYAYACLTAGLFQINVTDSMIPPSSPIRLNTSSFGILIPQLPKMFPNMLMELQVFADETPAVSLHMDSFSLVLSVAVKAYAIDNTTARRPLFRLNLTIQFNGKLNIGNVTLMGQMQFENLTLSLASSEIGTFQTKTLESTASWAVKTVFLQKLNAMLQKGFPLPVMKGVTLAGPVLQVQQGFLAVFSDVQIKYPLRTQEEF
ncbi:bactericidal permeability-increasing protein [Alosa pseudoharengus]|uniref:bactericidal permeability-increasing protein n=1 Tax=Alosa pseudoharengus TaxID=34774 RepID=UPI003F8A24CE